MYCSTLHCPPTHTWWPQHRYHEMSRCARQWRHLKQVKRGGGCHTTTALTSVADGPVANGTFALECPACPHPGRNLPTGWDKVDEDKKYIFLFSSRTQ